MKNNRDSQNKIQYMPIFMCLGMSVGMAIGVALDNIGIGMCLGLGIGVCLGALIDARNKKNEKDEWTTVFDRKSKCRTMYIEQNQVSHNKSKKTQATRKEWLFLWGLDDARTNQQSKPHRMSQSARND